MKKLLLQGVCCTLVLMIALFLFSVSLLDFIFSGVQELKETAPEAYAALESVQLTVESVPDAKDGSGAAAEPETTTVRITAAADEKMTFQQQIVSLMIEHPSLTGWLYAGLFGLSILALLPDVLPWQRCGKKERLIFLINAGCWGICGAFFLILEQTKTAVLIMNILYSLALIAKMVISLTERHKLRNIAPVLILLVLIAANFSFFPTAPLFVLFLIALRSLKQILKLSFAQIRLDVLRKVIRKTYAAEILFGMLLLIIAFSLLLSTLDDNITSFGDALWFCFATVTTIGYGDVTSTTLIGRILAVILGLYGIVVVALITSIIVNFYNETKAEPDGEEQRPPLPEKGTELRV